MKDESRLLQNLDFLFLQEDIVCLKGSKTLAIIV